MSEQTREEKVMAYSDAMLDSFKSTVVNSDDIILEYEKLLNNYTKLLKRYKKIVRLGDAFNIHLLKDNENKQQIARTKIMDNISEQRILKQELSSSKLDDKKQIEQLTKLLKGAMLKIKLLKTKTSYVEKEYDVRKIYNND